ncbi:MAG: XrtB/PEP-CTERM-associated polysaccharide biosynthesis outer membrane protein EpsL, partial [Burkholderiales bacterium]
MAQAARRRAEGRRSLRPLGLGCALAAGLLLRPTAALAFAQDRVSPYVEEKVSHDDNVFRLSRNQDPAAAIGARTGADTYFTSTVGVVLDVPLSRQRLQADLAWHDTRYQRFTDLDYAGLDLQATWLWQVGDRLSGHLGHSETVELASFAYIQTRSPDVLDTRSTYWDATYLLTPRWQLKGGLSKLAQTNRAPAYAIRDIEILGGEATVAYVTPAGTSIGFRARSEDGRFPNAQSVGGILVDPAYRQSGGELVAEWTIGAATRVSGSFGHVARHFQQLPQLDFAGNIAHAQIDWKPTGKLSLGATFTRDISAYEDLRSTFVLVTGVALRPVLKLSEKLELSATLDSSVRDYLGDPGFAAGGLP